MVSRVFASSLVVTLAAAIACGETGTEGKQIGVIELREGQRLIAAGTTVRAGADVPAQVTIGNSGDGVLLVKDIAISSTPAGAFTVESSPEPSEAAPIAIAPDAIGHTFRVAYHPEGLPEGERGRATVTVRTNLTLNSGTEITFDVLPEIALARVIVQPPILDFGDVESDSTATRTSNLLNTGAAPVTITRVTFAGHPSYTARFGGQSYTVTAESASTGIVFAPPLALAGGSALPIEVTYAAAGPESGQALLRFFTSDDPDRGVELKLYANVKGPCINVVPARVVFGPRAVGSTSEVRAEIQSCGDLDLVIDAVALTDDADGLFSVRADALGTLPATLPVGTSVFLPVGYIPDAPAVRGDDGEFVRDVGELRITSNAYLGALAVPIEGFGADGTCPTANIAVREGLEVLPQQKLHLSGLGSSAVNGGALSYTWSVVQPTGSASLFFPSATAPEVEFEPNIVGEYIFRLNVRDDAGNEACAPAEVTVIVTSDEAIHVELLWRTPGDPDETDSGGDQVSFSNGSDVDLHFLHPDALGFYFDLVFDCYWDNINPEWGAATPADNPRLDRDDTDGAGPENLNVSAPELGKQYKVGIHYWREWGYGEAFATVRVYIYGVLRDQWGDVRLVQDDLWDSHTIDWPGGDVTRLGEGAAVITPKYTGRTFP